MIQNVNFISFGPKSLFGFRNMSDIENDRIRNSNNDLISRLPTEGSHIDLDIRLVSKISILNRKLNFRGSISYRELHREKTVFLKKSDMVDPSISKIAKIPNFHIREIIIFDKIAIFDHFFNELFNAKFRRHFSCSTFPITPKS